MSHLKIIKKKRPDASGTTVSINFPSGVGLYISLECYREINQPDCGKLFNEAKNSKQQSCGKSIIPSAYVIGTGFLISKDTLDKTRRKSIITRLCNKPIRLIFKPFLKIFKYS